MGAGHSRSVVPSNFKTYDAVQSSKHIKITTKAGKGSVSIKHYGSLKLGVSDDRGNINNPGASMSFKITA